MSDLTRLLFHLQLIFCHSEFLVSLGVEWDRRLTVLHNVFCLFAFTVLSFHHSPTHIFHFSLYLVNDLTVACGSMHAVMCGYFLVHVLVNKVHVLVN